MTFSTNVPNASQSPGLFPAQCNTNFERLQTLLEANHKFNDTAAANDGYHQNIQMIPLATPANLAAAGQLFANIDVTGNPLTYKDTLNNVYQITPGLPLRAAVVFSPGGTQLYSFNVVSVLDQGSGSYKINFSNNIPSSSYYWTLNIIPVSSPGAIMVSGRSGVSPVVDSFQVTARQANGSGNNSFVSICALFYGG